MIVLLELDIFKFTKWFENGLQVLLSDVEVDVADIEAVKRDGIGVATRRFGVASLSILLSLCELHNDRNTCQWLSSELKCLLNSFFIFKFNITDSKNTRLANKTMSENM